MRELILSAALTVVSVTAIADCPVPQWQPKPSGVVIGNVRHPLATADFDGDGNLDAVVIRGTTAITDTALLLRGNGDGTFGAPQVIHQADQLFEAVAYDFNRDGEVDLLLEDGGFALVFLPGRGDGTFGAPVVSPTAEETRLIAAELTGDDIEDVALLGYVESGPDSLIVLAGNGQGSFVETQRQVLAGEAASIQAGDLDADGASDLVIGYYASSSIDLLFGNDNGTFDAPVAVQSGTYASSTTIADADGDGDADIVAPHWDDETVAVHRNLGSRNFSSVVYPLDIEITGLPNNPRSAAVADITRDGVRDLVVAAVNGPYLAVLRGNGDGTFAPAHFTVGYGYPGAIAAADLDRDGRMDILYGNRGPNGGLIAMRNGCSAGSRRRAVRH